MEHSSTNGSGRKRFHGQKKGGKCRIAKLSHKEETNASRTGCAVCGVKQDSTSAYLIT